MRADQSRPRLGNLARTAPAALLGGALATGAAALTASAYAAWALVTLDQDPRDDTDVLMVDADGPGTVRLGLAAHTTRPGRYGLWAPDPAGTGQVHVHLEGLVAVTGEHAVWQLATEDTGRIGTGRGRWDGYYYEGTPATVGLGFTDLVLTSPAGPLPCWHVPAADPASTRWLVALHGRGATRAESLRALAAVHRAGYHVLVPTYRSDAEAATEGRYGLGLREWEDADAALSHAVEHGATDLALLGWSMGGAAALQVLARSRHADLVHQVVLDAPVLSWDAVITHALSASGAPTSLTPVIRGLLGSTALGRVLGPPLRLADADWLARAKELRHDILLVHSRDDARVPFETSQQLALERPDLVHLAEFEGARHTCEWNVAPARWERLVEDYLSH